MASRYRLVGGALAGEPTLPRGARQLLLLVEVVPPFGTAAERSANAERLGKGILLHWNWLVCMVEPWREEPGFDHARWRRLYIRNAELQALVERFSQ
ncbi:hypothetical protein [Streptomyces triticiradicis]|uniref:hypothetical protein n=1 Tax=Streptomyces triticiradicis TaxID=2651189 RepID=UPI001788D450|nr:hypothetical protein [Streptomyces triticiradicis]